MEKRWSYVVLAAALGCWVICSLLFRIQIIGPCDDYSYLYYCQIVFPLYGGSLSYLADKFVEETQINSLSSKPTRTTNVDKNDSDHKDDGGYRRLIAWHLQRLVLWPSCGLVSRPRPPPHLLPHVF